MQVGTAGVAMAALTVPDAPPPADAFPLGELTVPETPSPERNPRESHSTVVLHDRTQYNDKENVSNDRAGKRNDTRAKDGGGKNRTKDATVQHKEAHPEHAEVLFHAARLFYGVRDLLIGAAPATLKATLLEPLEQRVGRELATTLLAKTDAEFCDMVAGAHRGRWQAGGSLVHTAAGVAEQLEAARDELQRRLEQLHVCKDDFQKTVGMLCAP